MDRWEVGFSRKVEDVVSDVGILIELMEFNFVDKKKRKVISNCLRTRKLG